MANGNPRLEVEIGAITTELKKGLEEARNELRKFNKEASSTDYKTALQAERLEQSKARTEAAQYRAEIAKLALEKRKSQGATQALSGSYREAQQRLTALGRSIREAEGGFTNTSPAIRAQIREYNELNNKLKEFDKLMGNHYRNVGNYGSALAGVIPVVGQFTSVAGAASAGIAGLQKAFSQNMAMDAFKTAMKVISGDAKEADKNLEFLRETSERLGLDFMSTAQAFKQWQGAAKFSNLTAEESRKIFESVANASAKMKLSSDQNTGAFLALSQMLSKGKVQAEELRGQLGERLPGAFALAAKAMGVTEQELNKMLEKGEVVANDFLPKFAEQLDKSFGNDKTEKISSMQAEVNRLRNAWDNLFNSENATAFFTEVTKGLANMVSEFDKTLNSKSFKEFFLRLGGGISTGITSTLMYAAADVQAYGGKVTPLQRAVNRNVSGFNELSNEQKKLKIQEQQALVTRLAKEYNEKKDKETLDRLTYQNATLAEMNRLYYDQLETKKKIAALDDEAKKPKGKSQADIIKEANEALRGGQIDNLRGIDNELAKIDKKWDGILEKVNKIADKGLKNQYKAQVEQGRELDKQLAKLDAWVKSPKLKSITGKDALKITPTFSSVPNIQSLLPTLPKIDFTTELSKEIKKGITRGIGNALTDLYNNIDDLGSNFYQVFTNVFQRLSGYVGNIMSDVIGRYLGEQLGDKIDAGEFNIGGLSAKMSTAIVAGAQMAGKVLGGMISRESVVGQGVAGALSGAASGAAIGAATGLAAGGPIGAAIGGVVGLLGGIFGAKEAKRQRELQEKQLAEQRKQTALMERQAMLAYSASVVGQQVNEGVVTAVERDAYGNLVAKINGKDIELVLERTKSGRG